MKARPLNSVLVSTLGCLAVVGSALADDSARDLRDQAQTDLQALLETSLPRDVERHVRGALRELERTADSFVDGTHVSSKEVFDRFHGAAESIREGARDAARRGQQETAGRLRADADRLAQSSRLLAATLVGEVRANASVIDRKSSQRRARALEKADREMDRAEAALAEDNHAQAIEHFKEAWKEAEKATRFRLALVEVSDQPDPFDPTGTQNINTLTARYLVRLRGDAQIVRTRWEILSSTGEVLRVIVGDTPAPRRQQGQPRVQEVLATLVFDGRNDDGGALLPDGTYSYRVTGAVLPEEDDEEEDEDDTPCENGNCLDGYLTGTVTIATVPPEWRDVQPEDGLITEDRRVAFHGVPFTGPVGVNLATVRLSLNGDDVTPQATISETAVDFTPPADLADGNYVYLASFANNAGRVVLVERRFRVVSAVGPIDPSLGGTVEVTDPDSPLYGVAITYPPGVAPPDTTAIISIPSSVPTLPEGATGFGMPADIEADPSTFTAPVTLTLRYSDAELNGFPEENLSVAFFEPSAGVWQLAPDFTVDTETNTLTVYTTTLSIWFVIGPPRIVNGLDSVLSTVEVLPPSMQVDDDTAPEAVVRVTLRRSDGSLYGPGQRVLVQFVSGTGTLGPVRDLQNGIYEADLNAPIRPGNAKFRAIANGLVLVQQPTATYVVGPVSALVFALVPAKVDSGQSFQATILAVDRFGNLVKSYVGTAQFATTDPIASIDGQPANGARTTFAQGQTSVQVVFRTAGVQTLRVEDLANPAIAGQVSISVNAGPAAQFTVVAGDGQSGLAGEVLPQTLRARLTDAFGNPLVGRLVQARAATGGGAAQYVASGAPPAQPITVATDAGGVASAFWRLGLVAGPQTFEMQVEGAALIASFTASATLPAPTLTRPGNGLKTYTTAIKVEGTSLPGVTVRVFANGVLVATTLTDASGRFSERTTPLTEGTWRIVARAQDAGGNESPDSRARDVVVDLTPPAPPSGVTLFVEDGSLRLRWSRNQEADLLGYLVFRQAPGETEFTQVTTGVLESAAFRDSNVTNGGSYRYRVRAVDDSVADEP